VNYVKVRTIVIISDYYFYFYYLVLLQIIIIVKAYRFISDWYANKFDCGKGWQKYITNNLLKEWAY
jgi:hypothetical protein